MATHDLPTLTGGKISGTVVDVDTLSDGTTLKVLTAAERTKLTDVAVGATANSTDAQLLNRANHTGTQAYTTITGLGGAATKNVGTAAGTVAAGDAVTNYAQGVTIPKGALDRWRTQRAASGTTRADVLLFGDSTAHGQTSTGDAAASVNNRPIAQYLRADAVAAGFFDGGVGIRGWNAAAGMSGTDNLAHVVSTVAAGGTWTTGTGGFYGGLFNNSIALTTTTGNVGASITLQGKGRYIRITDIANQTGGSTWTYAVDGGSAVTVSPPTGSAGRRARTTTIDTGSAGGASHQIVLAVTVDGTFECVVAWLNSKGVSFNTLALPGQKLAARFDPTQGNPIQSGAFLGLGDNAVVTEATTAAITGPWAPALAILHMGLNEQILGSTDQATAILSSNTLRQGVGQFAEMCRTAGVDAVVCIPHFIYATNGRQYSGLFRSALRDTALSEGLAVADLQIPLGSAISSFNVGVHLTAAGYQAQADWLWANVLST